MNKFFSIVALILSGSILFLFSSCSSSTQMQSNFPSENNITESSIPKSDIANENTAFGAKGAFADKNLNLEKMLTYAIQDEYLARTEYEYILKTFGEQKPFSNIIKSEESHIEKLKQIFIKYNLNLPTDKSINYLHKPNNIEESFKAGVGAEIENIKMYEIFLNTQIPDDVRNVFTELLNASKNHLQSFQRNLNK